MIVFRKMSCLAFMLVCILFNLCTVCAEKVEEKIPVHDALSFEPIIGKSWQSWFHYPIDKNNVN